MILNLTQHPATPEQVAAGVLEPADKAAVQRLLTFDEKPTADDIRRRAERLAAIAASHGVPAAMIGGAPYLMGPLEQELRVQGITPLYAFSVRESVEKADSDGTVRKTAVFRHCGFVTGVV